jgi:hypothetical protein
MTLLIPTWTALGDWAGVLIASLALIGLGRVLSLGRAAPESVLVAGWGAAAFALTLWGVATAASLRLPGAILLALGLLALLVPRLRLGRAEWRALGRIIAVALPLLAVMASARPSLPDTFLNLLPNAAYLYDHAAFPADDRPASHSFLPGAPYNLQFAAFLASFFTRGLPVSAMIAFNILLQLAFALFLARIIEAGEEAPGAAPSWTAVALGLLLTTALNPGFVPRYHLSSYSEASVTVCVAFAAWFAARSLENLAALRPSAVPLGLLALTLAALVNIKQDSIALAAGVIVSACVVAGIGRRWRSLAALALATLPAALLYLAWRWYVLEHFALGELKPLPLGQWQFASIPQILRSMAGVVIQKPYFFSLSALTVAALLWRLRQRGLDRPSMVAALFLGTAVIYNLALFGAYIAHFPGQMGSDAHSYFRYNTHLGLLLVLALVLLVRDIAAERRLSPSQGARRLMLPVLMLALLLCPVIFLRVLRFDLEDPQQRAWQLAALASRALTRDHRLALLLPGDNGSLAAMLEGLIRYTPPRHLDADLRVVMTLAPDTLDHLAKEGYRRALLSCLPAPPGETVPPEAALLAKGPSGWDTIALEPFAPPRFPHWSHVIAEAPLCFSGAG